MFKRGAQYSRDEIASLARPEEPPKGGNWTTGYARIGNELYVFMNMGVPGRTGHDFDNHYDEKSQTLIWFGKPGTHSTQPLFKKLMSEELKPLFFARWNQSAPFTFLGTGSVISFEDDYITGQGHRCVKLFLHIKDIHDIVNEASPKSIDLEKQNSIQQSFLFEKHLEDFIFRNWRSLPIGNQYDIYEEGGELLGRQFSTQIGPIDLLGLSKDKSEFLVLELKRDRASDKVVGQTLRYMGWIKEHMCTPVQDVKGCIIAQAEDQKLTYALKQVPSIRFMKYEVDFRLM